MNTSNSDETLHAPPVGTELLPIDPPHIRRLKSYHESGHAAIGFRLGLGVEKVTVEQTLFCEGRCELGRAPSTPFEKLQVSIAGNVAADLLEQKGQRVLSKYLDGCNAARLAAQAAFFDSLQLDFDPYRDLPKGGTDREVIVDVLNADSGASLDDAIASVNAFLREDWPRVCRLADELDRVGTVSGPRVAELLSDELGEPGMAS